MDRTVCKMGNGEETLFFLLYVYLLLNKRSVIDGLFAIQLSWLGQSKTVVVVKRRHLSANRLIEPLPAPFISIPTTYLVVVLWLKDLVLINCNFYRFYFARSVE